MNPRFSIKKGARASRPLRYHKPAGETPTLPYSTRTRTGRPLRYHKPAGETPTLPYSTRMRVGRPLRYHKPAGGTPTLPYFACRGASTRQRGVALVMVLTIVVLVAVASVAFFAAISLERQSSAAYANSGEARLAADSAVNLVMGQIREATEQTNSVWTSQPGLLRTFSAGGTPGDVYKLYSSSSLRMSASSFNPANDVPTGWASNSAAYVDLNRPTSSRSGGITRLTYPILDPRASGKVEGFDISNWSHNGTNSLPMPVAWMYVAKNGNLTTWDNLDPDNPPIARIAFWTDDETSKININTASEGNFWDIPRTSMGMQTWDAGVRGAKSCYNLAISQPAQREYQSYPGHPATTSLSPVLWKYFKAASPSMTRHNNGTSGSFPETLYAMLPRTSGNGSMGGTVPLNITHVALPAKTQRLFSSVDELAFLPPTSGNSTADRVANPLFPRDTIEETRFFLTAYNRAPELNLFNLPRVTIWPIHASATADRRTPFDNLIAFASTINNKPYYFARSNPDSMTDDANIARNQTLYSYLQALTAKSVPGFGGGTFAAKYSQDRDQILTEIFDYVRCTNINDTSSANPSFKTYAQKAEVVWVPGENRDNSKTLPGSAQVLPTRIGSTSGFGRMPTLNRVIFHIAAARDVPVIVNGNATGDVDRELEAALYFETFIPTQGYPITHSDFEIRVSTAPAFSVSTNGSSGNITTVPFSFTGTNIVNGFADWGLGGYQGYYANTFTFTDGTILPNVNQKPKIVNDAYPPRNYPFVVQGIRLSLKNPADPDNPSQDIEVGGGVIQVQLVAKNVVYQTFHLQFPSFTTTMPRVAVIPGNISINPPLAPSGIQARFGQFVPGWGWMGLWNYRQLSSRLADAVCKDASSNPQMTYKPQMYSMYLLREEDVVRSLEPTGSSAGDLRLIAASPTTTNALEPLSGAGGRAERVFSAMSQISEAQTGGQVFHWFSGWNGTTGGNFSLNDNRSWGRLVKDNDWQGPESSGAHPEMISASIVPAVYNGIENQDGAVGDFDTGIGSAPDGPYVNKADEGAVPSAALPVPYVANQNGSIPPGQTFSSPSRQLPSPVAFGSLPTGVKAGHPWQTLLFNPVPASLYGSGTTHAHPGASTPPDHLLLDLFHIPVVEPYAISEPFSTAGKVNMNYQIIPFTGIERSTALHGALYPVRVMAIRSSTGRSLLPYKQWGSSARLTYRYPINVPETLQYFQDRFADSASGHVFKSASEICEIPLIPSNDTSANATIPLIGDPYGYNGTITRSTLDDFWEANRVTGDNLREQPYNVLYPRLTTRSNTFTVHVWVQTLKKLPGTDPTKWVEGKDRVTAEFRGSYLIERYLNPAEADIPDYASNPTGNLNAFYRFRIISAKQFDP